MSKFNAEEYKKQVSESTSCDKCDKIPAVELKKDSEYIFISYSHKDYKKVYCDLADLYESDIPFWYDEGLPAGKNWDDVVRERMTDSRCAGIIFYLSENLFLSRSIQTEICIACGKEGNPDTPSIKRDYFSVNLTDKSPSDILKSVYSDKEFPDTEDAMAAQREWVDVLSTAFPDKATYLSFDAPKHKEKLVIQIGVNFGINPNYNPYSFGDATFRSGKGIIEFSNGAVYDGEFADGLFDGYGEIKYLESGDEYKGQWKKGLWHGKGEYKDSDGVVYLGDFVNGKRCGHGKVTMSSGLSYDGKWLNGKMNGKGIATFPDGTVYDGEWLDGKMNGKGVMTFSNGAFYDGEWLGGKMHGKGVMTYSSGAFYDGEWLNGKMHGKGVMTFSSGAFYDGEWLDGEMHGKGVMTFSSGAFYDGEWVGGKWHGMGTLTFADGTTQAGYFENDDFVGLKPE